MKGETSDLQALLEFGSGESQVRCKCLAYMDTKTSKKIPFLPVMSLQRPLLTKLQRLRAKENLKGLRSIFTEQSKRADLEQRGNRK